MLRTLPISPPSLCGAPLLACKSGRRRETPSRTCGGSISADLGWLSGRLAPGATVPSTLEEHWTHADGGTLLGVKTAPCQRQRRCSSVHTHQTRETGSTTSPSHHESLRTDFKLVLLQQQRRADQNLQNEHPQSTHPL